MSEEQAYYNTTNTTGATLQHYRERAKSQDKDVMHVLKKLNGLNLITPYAVFKVLQSAYKGYEGVPVDSIKRSFSNLKKSGMIRTNGNKTMGNYGRKVKCWELTN